MRSAAAPYIARWCMWMSFLGPANSSRLSAQTLCASWNDYSSALWFNLATDMFQNWEMNRNDGKKASQSVQTQMTQHLSACAPSRIWPLQIFSNFASNDFFSFSPLGVKYTRSSSSSLEEHIPQTAKYRKARPIKTQLGWEIRFKSLLHRSFWVKWLSLCSLSLKSVCRNLF